jgi:hypothetical protein
MVGELELAGGPSEAMIGTTGTSGPGVTGLSDTGGGSADVAEQTTCGTVLVRQTRARTYTTLPCRRMTTRWW